MKISVVGVNHQTAPVDVRETVSLAGGLAPELLRVIRQEGIFQEALVLDTCNRTEIYYVAGEQPDALQHVLAHIAQLKGAAPLEDASAFYHFEGLDAVSHLCRVAAGLDSQVLGEDEILGQVRDAYAEAVRAGTARFRLWAAHPSRARYCHRGAGGHNGASKHRRPVARVPLHPIPIAKGTRE